MSFRAAIRAALCAALLLTESCGGGSNKPPRATLGPEVDSESAIRFEDLPVTRLERSRVPIPNAANPSLGAPDAKVVVQMWSDFECPFCAEVHPVLTEMLRVYAGKVRLVWHDYPLPFHAHSRLAANAGREAYAQGGAAAFWKFHDAVYGASSAAVGRRGPANVRRQGGPGPGAFSRSAQHATSRAQRSNATSMPATRWASKERPRSWSTTTSSSARCRSRSCA